MESKERKKDCFVKTGVLQYTHQVEAQAKPKCFGALNVENIVKAYVVLLFIKNHLISCLSMLM